MNVTASSITNVDDAKLIAQIGAANQRVLLLAPGVSEPVAHALRDAWLRLGTANVDVILDVDAAVCHLGYGTMDGLNALQEASANAQTAVFHQPGVRIGVLICDEETLIFSPTPLLIEAGSTRPDYPNGVQLAPPPQRLVRDLGLDKNSDQPRVIGIDPVKDELIADVKQELSRVPPVKFDLARRVRVFTSRFQFVELEMSGCFVSRKRVPIPSNLVGLANDYDVASQFHAHFNLVNSSKLEVRVNGRVVTEDSLAKRKQLIMKDLLVPLKGYGSVVLRANKERLVHAVEELKADVVLFQEGIKKDLQKNMDENAISLVEALLPAVLARPPESYTKILGPKVAPAQIRLYLERDIRDAFGEAAELVQEMKVSLVFKDMAYDSLVDQKFLKTAREAMPEVDCLHEEHDAAQAVLY